MWMASVSLEVGEWPFACVSNEEWDGEGEDEDEVMTGSEDAGLNGAAADGCGGGGGDRS